MLTQDTLSKIKRLFFKTDKLSSELLAGEYRSAFKGTGLNFESIREYQYGDEIKSLDWKVTARMQSPYVRQYKEERQMTLLLVVDFSASNDFGTQEKTKKDLIIELASVLAFLAIKNNDKVGLMICTEDTELYLEPKQGKAHVFRLLKELVSFKAQYKTTNLKKVFQSVNKLSPKHAIICVLSDFINSQNHSSEANLNYIKELKILKQTRDLNLISIRDPKEFTLPNLGFIKISNPENGQSILVNLNNKKEREKFAQAQEKTYTDFKNEIRKTGIRFLHLKTDCDYILELQRFLKV